MREQCSGDNVFLRDHTRTPPADRLLLPDLLTTRGFLIGGGPVEQHVLHIPPGLLENVPLSAFTSPRTSDSDVARLDVDRTRPSPSLTCPQPFTCLVPQGVSIT